LDDNLFSCEGGKSISTVFIVPCPHRGHRFILRPQSSIISCSMGLGAIPVNEFIDKNYKILK